MSRVSFADVVFPFVTFDSSQESERLLLNLIDSPWIQRLRDISQTANTRLVYMFSEHSRFGHSLGVAYLASQVIENLARQFGERIEPYRKAVLAACLLHDIGHLAPGSHVAMKAWFPGQSDAHEEMGSKIVVGDQKLAATLLSFKTSPESVSAIIAETSRTPAWTVELLSGSGWNVDRGNWCILDSIMAGVSYGKYNIQALTESLTLTNDDHLAIKESRIDAMMHFTISRHAIYRQVYQHRVLLAADRLSQLIVQRAREVKSKINFLDSTMEEALAAKSPAELTLKAIFEMTESWWRYHLQRWCSSKDLILADLSQRLLQRRLFKTVRAPSDLAELKELETKGHAAVTQAGFDPQYYFHQIGTSAMQGNEEKRPPLVLLESGQAVPMHEIEPISRSLVREGEVEKRWFAMPAEAKEILLGSL